MFCMLKRVAVITCVIAQNVYYQLQLSGSKNVEWTRILDCPPTRLIKVISVGRSSFSFFLVNGNFSGDISFWQD